MSITAGKLYASAAAPIRMVFALLAALAIALSLGLTRARAATLEETLADDVFVNEPGSTGRCTIYAATNMLRRAALLNGDQDWSSITTSSIPSSGGLLFSFSVSTQEATYAVEHGYITGSTVEERTVELLALLDENPAGIVLYTSTGNPHAVTLLGYDEESGAFIAHDSLAGATSSLDECVSVRASNADAYWYVSSPVSAPGPVSIRNAVVTVEDAVYAGESVTPQVTVTLDGATLTEGTDYAISYVGNNSVGTALAVVSGAGSYNGTASAGFEVLDGTKVLVGRCAGTVEASTGSGQALASSRGASMLGVAA
ncbi:hypothetical protein [Olsenella sp. kh2p3]|jgi:hypothetical protein|uniref:hypothetical protein n=1 Tax=Olsenella sp. kh2p3 TaxID=1797112 RepID=UPI0009192B15|nr:hypothetical protein [Olsenella sp. kh2p3]MCI2085851.1 hypothetical protein [Olsenella sp.]SFX10037.1 hypothetical protein SAMN04487823_101484 [Olsenella sp. kh2p3]